MIFFSEKRIGPTSDLEEAILRELATPDQPQRTADPDAAYFASMVPAFKRLNLRAQAQFKIDLAKLFFHAEFPIN